MTEEAQVTTISEKGQVVIPQSIRKELGIKPKTKFLVFGRGDTVIMKRLKLPDVKKEWEEIFKMMDKKELKLTEEQIQEEIMTSRKEKLRSKKSKDD
jgi:AbrB family looped-hinge helix DNA binding protein